MPEKVLVFTAWPYANGPLHLGHVAGCYLPADIFARYHRTAGNQVLMLSGSDQHGTPVTVRAEQEGVSPAEVAARYHEDFLASWDKLGISFDLFTRTGTDNHRETVHEIFRAMVDKGYLYRDTMELLFCENDQRFLPDRYVNGTCPNCGYTNARGDQCDECGHPLNATELIDPRCVFCKTQPIIRDSEHYFLKLSAFESRLQEWVADKDYWRANVQRFTANYLREGLHDRAITRDIEWGVPLPAGDGLPTEGWDHKRIYVWFEAVIGYLSAAREWSQRNGTPDAWREYWQDPECRAYYFIGKDNIPFHTIIWPGMIIGYNESGGGLNMPFDVPANEFLGLEGKQFSTSRNWAVWLPDYLSRYDPDPLRYQLSINMPEAGDTDFSWREYVRRNNDELVATYGNLVNRVLTFTYRNFDGKVPAPGQYDMYSQDIVQRTHQAFETVGNAIEECRFRDAIRSAMSLAQQANKYLDERAPWKTIKEDRDATATTLHAALTAISGLKQLMYPFIPFSSERLHGYLGREGTPQSEGWRLRPPIAGTVLQEPAPLFKKLDDGIIDEETSRLG